MKRKKVLIFGAGSAGKSFIDKNEKYEILYIIDNSENKKGTIFSGIEVILPSEIKNIDYDYIFITSAYFPEIYKQLTEELKIKKEKIKMPPKSMTGNKKSYRPFECKNTYKLAGELLVYISNLLEKNNIPYFIDHGTLLGLVRDGDIIPWDDDIDISVENKYMQKCLEVIDKNLKNLPRQNDLEWYTIKYYREKDDTLAKILLVFKDKNNKYKEFPLSIENFILKDGFAIQELSYSPSENYLENDYIKYKNKILSVPYNYEDYLTLHYGDWKKIKKDTNFLDAKNYKMPDILYNIGGI